MGGWLGRVASYIRCVFRKPLPNVLRTTRIYCRIAAISSSGKSIYGSGIFVNTRQTTDLIPDPKARGVVTRPIELLVVVAVLRVLLPRLSPRTSIAKRGRVRGGGGVNRRKIRNKHKNNAQKNKEKKSLEVFCGWRVASHQWMARLRVYQVRCESPSRSQVRKNAVNLTRETPTSGTPIDRPALLCTGKSQRMHAALNKSSETLDTRMYTAHRTIQQATGPPRTREHILSLLPNH